MNLNILPRLRQLPVGGQLEGELGGKIIFSNNHIDIIIDIMIVIYDDDKLDDGNDKVEATDDDDDNLSQRSQLTLDQNPSRGSEE